MQDTKVLWGVQAVGETAGQVWSALKRQGKTSLSAMEREIDAPQGLTQMAIGWLAREGKIEIGQERRAVSLWLTESGS